MKVIFLDVDGVLNSVRSMVALHRKDAGYRHDFIDPIAVALINRLTDITGAKLVISSTHRKHIPDPLGNGRCLVAMQKYFDNFGITGKVIGYTPCSSTGHRGTEINEWICNEREHSDELTHYVIIDDDSDMLESQMPFFVKTNAYEGFGYHNYKDTLRILGCEDKI